MNFASHLSSLYAKKAQLEEEVKLEMQRPMPDFLKLSEYKKRKMVIKAEIMAFEERVAAAEG